MSTKAKEILQFAKDLEPTVSDWYTFHNALFGITGRLQKLFKTQTERAKFFESKEYKEIEKLEAEVQKRQAKTKETKILVRLPESLKEQLTREAEEAGFKSVNELCLKKLARPVETLV